MSDSALHDQLRTIGETYLRLVEDKPAFARRQSEYWAQVARLEQRQAERLDWRKEPRRSPSSQHFQAVTAELDHSRAKTTRHDMTPLLEGEAEHRPTPVVPDPRKDP